MAAGIDARTSGSMARTLSTVPTMFAPGCRLTAMMMAGLPSTQSGVVDILDRILNVGDIRPAALARRCDMQ